MMRSLSKEVVFFHVPNTAKRGLIEGAYMKAMGVRAGVPDLIIAWQGVTVSIEMKAGKGEHSDAQLAMQGRLSAIGWRVFECRSLDDFKQILVSLGVPQTA